MTEWLKPKTKSMKKQVNFHEELRAMKTASGQGVGERRRKEQTMKTGQIQARDHRKVSLLT